MFSCHIGTAGAVVQCARVIGARGPRGVNNGARSLIEVGRSFCKPKAALDASRMELRGRRSRVRLMSSIRAVFPRQRKQVRPARAGDLLPELVFQLAGKKTGQKRPVFG